MVSTKEAFSSLDDLKGPNILLEDNSKNESNSKGSIYFDHGSFNKVLYVPGLAANLLSLYYMNHIGSPKKVVFSLNEVEIFDIGKGRIDLDNGSFNDVLYVPCLTSNLFLLYQMTHTGSPKKVFLSPNDV